MATRTRNRNRKRNRPQNQPVQPFRIDIEFEAVCDYMTMLRGFCAHGKFYENFLSDELTRFPAFDGSDWEELLPENVTFQNFLHDAINGKSPRGLKLFDKARPYDFAYRDLTYLHRKGCQIVFHVPEFLEPYLGEIKQWSKKYFPPNETEITIRVVPFNPEIQIPASNVWVVRNPVTAERLKNKGQPFILIDGKENSHIEDVNRVLRWDQAGFLLRHAQIISHLRKSRPEHVAPKHVRLGPNHVPHRDVFQGLQIQLLLADDALLWVGDQLRSINLVLNDPDQVLSKIEILKKVDASRFAKFREKVLGVLTIDKSEMERRGEFLKSMILEKAELIYDDSDWTAVLKEREAQMVKVLSDLETELRINPVTGGELEGRRPNIPRITTSLSLGQRLLSGNADEPIVLQLSGTEVIKLLSRNWDEVLKEELGNASGEISGSLAEIMTGLILRESKWKLLVPKENAGNSNSIAGTIEGITKKISETITRKPAEQERVHRRIELSWNDLKSGELRSAEVDFVARGPGGKIFIGEVKLSTGKPLSNLQVELREHIKNGGRIHNPGFPSVRSQTFAPNWREIRIGDSLSFGITPSTSISEVSRRL